VHIYKLGDTYDKKTLLKNLGVESGGVSIISKKMQLHYYLIRDIKAPAANILKQDALSIGAELAVPRGVVTCDAELFDCILIGNQKQIEIISTKELSQPFGLKGVAQELARSLKPREFPIQIMGVINANDDSFFAGSRYLADDAVAKIEQMIADGADIIDIGAVSSRPDADEVSASVELERIKPICDSIRRDRLHQRVVFSVDSYTPEVVEYALESGFKIINDITGARDDRVIQLAMKYKAKLCIMHMQGTPQSMQKNPRYDDVVIEVSEFLQERIARCEKLGLDRDSIILDVGIGFGKSLEHNISLIKNIAHFRLFGCELLIGASRKSMIDHISPSTPEDRLAGTLSIHLKALEGGVSIIRCHDVKEHLQAIRVFEALR